MFGLTRETKITVSGETSKYERSMRNVQRVNERTINVIKKGWGNARKSVLNFRSAVVGLGGVYVINRLVGQFEELSAVQEKAEGGMTAAMKSMGRYSEEWDSFIKKTASGIQELTTFGDEAVLQGTKFLMTYKEIGNEEMPRVMMAMTDLAALMKGDFQSAANMLGKASMGMTGELRKAGITVDSTTYKSEGFLGVLKQIEDQVKGQAEALRATKAGGLEAFGNVVGDIKEKVGLMSSTFKAYIAKDLLPYVTELNDKLGEWVKNNEGVIESYAKMVSLKIPEYINNIRIAFEELKGPVAFVAEHWKMIMGAFVGAQFGPIGAVLGAGVGAWAEVYQQLTKSYTEGSKSSAVLINQTGKIIAKLEEQRKTAKALLITDADRMKGIRQLNAELQTQEDLLVGLHSSIPIKPEIISHVEDVIAILKKEKEAITDTYETQSKTIADINGKIKEQRDLVDRLKSGPHVINTDQVKEQIASLELQKTLVRARSIDEDHYLRQIEQINTKLKEQRVLLTALQTVPPMTKTPTTPPGVVVPDIRKGVPEIPENLMDTTEWSDQQDSEYEMALQLAPVLEWPDDWESGVSEQLDKWQDLYNQADLKVEEDRQAMMQRLSGMAMEAHQADIEAYRYAEDEKARIAQQSANKRLELESWLRDEMSILYTKGTSDFINNLKTTFLAFSKNSKTMFTLFKAISMAQAIISGAAGAAAAWKAGMEVGGPYAPVVAAAYMAASIAATGAQIAAIAGTEIGSNGQLSPGGVPATPTYPVSPDTGLPTGNDSGSSLTIYVEGDFIGDEAYIEKLAEKINEGVEDRDVRLVASHSQYAEALA